MKNRFGAVAVLLLALPLPGLAQEDTDPIDEIIVAGHSITARTVQTDVQEKFLVDTARALKDMPGGNVNSNGSITGIAQYRGMYGDRVAITIDNHAIVSGGPNAMDAPLSYASPMITEALVVERGIASVSSAPESIGGYLTAKLARGRFGGEDFGLSGFVGTRYSLNGDVRTSAGRLTMSNSSHRFSSVAELSEGQDIDTPAGEIRPSTIDRKRYDVSYAYTNDTDHLVFFAGKLDTQDSGTAALPMDIRFIDTTLAGAHFLYTVSPEFLVEGRVSANDVEHLMDNFALREAPAPMMQRQTFTTGTGTAIALAGEVDYLTATLRFGFDGTFANHDAEITNPNNPEFRVANFRGVERDLASLFAEWVLAHESMELELGISIKRVTTDADAVGATGIMSPAVGTLAETFNNADRNLTFDDVDAVVKFSHLFGGNAEWRIEAARKSRAPSYQELYLWLPMQSTGGLADGRTYIGNLELDSEVSNEINLGLFTRNEFLNVSPQIFYKRIDDYIQGSPSNDDTANGVSVMMTGKPALEFLNTDAEIWGFDLAIGLKMSDHLTLDGIASYARGRRRDVNDDLYRLAPLNGSIGLTYATDVWAIDSRVLLYGEQSKVAAFNDEQASGSYEIVDAGIVWTPNSRLRVETRIHNVFDKEYQDHLAGINRANGSGIPIGARLYGAERTLGAGIIFSF